MNGVLPDDRSKRYAALKTRMFLLDLIFTVLLVAVFQVFISSRAATLVSAILNNFFARCLVYSSIFLMFMYFILLPLKFYSSFIIEHQFGLSCQNFFLWCLDEIKSAALSFLFALAGIEVFYLLLRGAPRSWPILLAFVWITFSIVLTRLAPVILIPIFFRYSSLDNGSLRERLAVLAKKAGIPVMDICRIDLSRKTKKANAALVGLGNSRRVVLADTLVDGFDEDEIEMVAAHEFGHHKMRHLWQLLLFSGISSTVGFYVLYFTVGYLSSLMSASGVSDLKIFPSILFLFMVFSFILLPLQNFFSRFLEKQADRYALDLIKRPEVFERVMSKLGKMNLSDPSPSFLKKIFLYDHPPLAERIKMAREWETRGQGSRGKGQGARDKNK